MLVRFDPVDQYTDTRYHGKDWHPVLSQKKYRRYVPMVQSLAAELFESEADQIAWGRRCLAIDQGGIYFHPVYLHGTSRTNPGFGQRLLYKLNDYPALQTILK